MCSAEDAYNSNVEEGTDGLTKVEAANALYDMGQNPTPIQIANFWEKNSKTDDDLITVDELKELHESLGDPDEALKEAFRVFDKDPDGAISREELEEILRKADIDGFSGFADDKEMLDVIFQGADKNGDNKLQLDEFIDMIKSGEAGITNEPLFEQTEHTLC